MCPLLFAFYSKSEGPKILPQMRREAKALKSGGATMQKTSLAVTLLLKSRMQLSARFLRGETYVFYKVPKTLFTDEKYCLVSTDAKCSADCCSTVCTFPLKTVGRTSTVVYISSLP